MDNFKEAPFIIGKDFITTLFENTTYDKWNAIAELIDNSLAANATEINISIKADEYGKTVFKITDNGDGMSYNDFANKFMVLGDSTNKNNKKSSSYFGIGGKAGVIFLSKDGGVIEIVTHKKENLTCSVIWGRGLGYPKIRDEDNNQPFGTTIIIKDSILNADTDPGKVLIEIGAYYYHALVERKLTIRVNGNKVKPNDPMYRKTLSDEDFIYASANIGGDKAFIRFVSFNDGKLKKEQINEYDKMICKGKKSNALSMTATSGLYIVCGGRYISFGANIDLLGRTSHTSLNGNRAEIILTKEMASLLKIKWNKVGLSRTFKENEYATDLLNVLSDLFSKHVKSN